MLLEHGWGGIAEWAGSERRRTRGSPFTHNAIHLLVATKDMSTCLPAGGVCSKRHVTFPYVSE